MADIFISYAREDRNWVRGLAQALEGEGYSVWWDPNLLPGTRYRETIEKELEQAYASIVVWSSDSIQSDFVRDEAEEARVLNRLIPVLKDAVQPPHGFRQIQTADLSDWRGKADHAEFVLILEGVQALAKAKGGEAPIRKPKKKEGSTSAVEFLKTPVGTGVAAGAILVAVVLAFVLGRSGQNDIQPRPSEQFQQAGLASNSPSMPQAQQPQAPPVNPAQMTMQQKLATCLSDNQQAQIMITICSDALQTANLPPPSLARVHANRGIAYETIGQHQNAVNDLNIALDLDPKDELAILNRGFAYNGLGQYDAAAADYNRAIALDPTDATAFGARGDLESRNWQLDAAIADYQKATQLRPGDFLGWKSLCLTRALANKDLTQALSECSHALELDRSAWGAHDATGLIKLRLADYPGAIDAFTRALSFQSNLATSLYGRAMAEEKMGNHQAANQDFYNARAQRSDIDSLFTRMGLSP